jgi:hypothetical protein
MLDWIHSELDAKVSVKIRRYDRLFSAAAKGGYVSVLEWLDQHGAIHSYLCRWDHPFGDAVFAGNIDAMEWLHIKKASDQTNGPCDLHF